MSGQVTEAVYQTPEPNTPIVLYEGDMELKQGDGESETHIWGKGRITYHWQPTPSIEWELPMEKYIGRPKFENCTITIPSRFCVFPAYVSRIRPGKVSGDAIEAVLSNHNWYSPKVQQLRLHIPNFLTDRWGSWIAAPNEHCEYAGRTKVELSDWTLTLDLLGHIPRNRRDGGHMVTHVMVVERPDNSEFDPNMARELVESLYSVFSFCTGQATGAVLVTGHNLMGQVCWKWWRTLHIDAYQSRTTWLPSDYKGAGTQHHPSFSRQDAFKALLRGFTEVTSISPIARRTLSTCVYWYLKARDQSVESAVIFSVLILETLTWFDSVITHGEDPNAFEASPAKVSAYLETLEIPHDELYEGQGAIERLIEMRDTMTHPPKGGDFKEYPDIMRDHVLALYLMERAFLRVLGYNGYMFDRRTGRDVVVGVLPEPPTVSGEELEEIRQNRMRGPQQVGEHEWHIGGPIDQSRKP